MKTIEQVRKDKINLEKEIAALLLKFENEYGQGLLHDDLSIRRHNGSTDCNGKIVGLSISMCM